MVQVNGTRYVLDSHNGGITKIECFADGSEQIAGYIQHWAICDGAQSMRYMLEQIGSFNAKNIAFATFNYPKYGQVAIDQAQKLIDYVVSKGLIKLVGSRYEAVCMIDTDVLLEAAA